MQTGEVSERLKRGKHTTRHVELIKFNEGYIVDTPGFSMLDFPEDITKDMIKGKVGAGDAFCAGMLYSLYKEFDPEYSLRVAGAAAGCTPWPPGSG